MLTLKNFLLKDSLLLLAVLLAILYSHSLFHSGLLPTHDGEYHVVRFFEFDKTFRDGSLYPRWAPDLNNGFGIPLFNYVYPLPNYIALLFHSFGFSFIDSFKLNLFFATVIGAIFSYLWSKEFWGRWGGLATSVFYTFSPYHSLDIFIRGSVGEVWAIAFFPAFLWCITKVIKGENYRYILPSGIILSLIIFSHNILAFMFFFFSLAYSIFLFLNSKKKLLFPLIGVFASGVGISSIFWLPAIFERQYVRGLEVYDYSRNFPDLYQLIIPSWGSGFSSGSLQNQLSFQIGIANLIAFVSAFFLMFKKFKNKSLVVFFLVWFFVIFILMLKISLPFWRVFPFMNYFQFPWRFLSLMILFTSFLAGSILNLPKGRFIISLAIALSILLGMGYTGVAYYLERNDSYYTTRSNFIDGTNSPGNSFNTMWMDQVNKKKEKLVFAKGEGIISKEKNRSTFSSYEVDIKKQAKLNASIAYFPNWRVYVDGKIQKSGIYQGLISFSLSPGKHNVSIKFEDTLVRKIALAISLISILALLSYMMSVKMKGGIKNK